MSALPRDVFLELLTAAAPDDLDPADCGGFASAAALRADWLERYDQAGVDALHDATQHTDLPYEDVAEGPVTVDLGEQGDLVLIDTVIARSTMLAGTAGTQPFVLPIVILDLQQGRSSLGEPPLQVHRVGITGPAGGLRKIGKLLRDACYGAANAVERG